MESRTATLLRYRFGDLQQMQNHLHVIEGRTLFFLRDGKAALVGGARVVIEFALQSSEQVSVMRGAVLSRVDAMVTGVGQAGMWIEFPDARLAKKVDQGIAAITSRKQRRLGCDLLVEVKQGRMPYLGRMVDVSLGGARIVGAVGLRAHHEVEIRLMGSEEGWPPQLGRSEVIRADHNTGDTGIRFQRLDPVARQASAKLFQAVQKAWTVSPEFSHSPLCCQGGHLLEPPMPHMKNRT